MILEQVGCRISHAPNMAIVLLVRRGDLLYASFASCLSTIALITFGLALTALTKRNIAFGLALALGALDVACAVVFKEGPDAHEFLELLFPFFRRELLLEVTHIRSGDDTTKMDEKQLRETICSSAASSSMAANKSLVMGIVGVWG